MEYAFVRKHGILDKIIASQLDKLQPIEFLEFLIPESARSAWRGEHR